MSELEIADEVMRAETDRVSAMYRADKAALAVDQQKLAMWDELVSQLTTAANALAFIGGHARIVAPIDKLLDRARAIK